MKITKDHKFHYFIKESYNKYFHEIEIRSILEIPQRNGEVRLKRLEDVRVFMSKDHERNECGTFEINFGKDDGIMSGFNTVKEMNEWMLSDRMIYGFRIASKEEYLQCRKNMFDIYMEHPTVDFERLKPDQEK